MSTVLKTLDLEQSKKLLEYLHNNAAFYDPIFKNARNYIIGLLMLDAGLRVGELVLLRVTDLFLEGQPVKELHIRAEIAKNKTARDIPLTPRLYNALEQFIGDGFIKHIPNTIDFLFHKPYQTNHLTTRTIQKLIEKASVAALGFKIHPHILRHTFATQLMRKTNIRVVQQLLGHKTLASTEIYTHPNNQDLTQAIQALPS